MSPNWSIDQVLLGTVVGASMGLLFSQLLRMSERKGYIDRSSYLGQYLSLTLFTVGAAGLLGADDLLAAFAAGSSAILLSHVPALAQRTSVLKVRPYHGTVTSGNNPWPPVLLLTSSKAF